jgi:hypothetical protein
MDYLTPVFCPVDRKWLWMTDEDEHTASLYREVALLYRISVWEQMKMLSDILLGPNDPNHPDYLPKREMLQHLKVAKRDADLLKFELPLTEALAIWSRAKEGLLCYAELYPERRAEIEAFLAERDKAMLALQAKAEAMAKRKVAG